jgi:hypothetical protein
MTLQIASRQLSAVAGRVISLAGFLIIGMATMTPAEAKGEAVEGLCVVCGDLGGVDAVLNILLFLPVGIGSGLMKVNLWKGLAAFLALTVTIEYLQLTVIPGRDAAVGDVLMNTIGGGVGLLSGHNWKSLVYPAARLRRLLIGGAAGGWLIASLLTGYTLQLRPSEPPYYGQLARKRSDDPAYPGSVSRARLGSIEVSDERLSDSPRIADALRRGEEFSIHLVPFARPERASPIARIAGDRDAENAAIYAIGDLTVFRVRTNASVLRLRPYAIGVAGGLAIGQPVIIAGTFLPGGARLTVTGEKTVQVATVGFGIGSGWRLILPVDSVATGSIAESLFDILWISFLLFPLSYWFTTQVPERRLLTGLIWLTAAVTASVVLMNAAFGLATASRDTVGTVAGLGLGAFSTRLFRRHSR